MSPIAHWDEVESGRAEVGHLAAVWSNLGSAAGSRGVGVQRIQVDPGKWSTPAHLHSAEEEIFYVLGGSGLSWQQLADQDPRTYDVAEGDCIVHRPAKERHTLRAGADGLEVLAFGTRVNTEIGYLPRAGVAWIGRTWAAVGGGDHPWEREAEAEEPPTPEPEPGERPPNIKRADEIEGGFGGVALALGAAAGAERTGLNLVKLPPGEEGAPPHCHAAEEEIFVVLEGTATLTLTPAPARSELGVQEEQHQLRRGHVVARPPGTGIAHSFVAGPDGMTCLAYGTREPNDVAYYPRSGTFYLRGVGVHGRIEPVPLRDR